MLGIIRRVPRGHTARQLRAAPVIVFAYALVLAFMLFFVHYAPILTRLRPDGKRG